MYFINQVNIWGIVDNEQIIIVDGKECLLYHPGEWYLKEYQEGKKVYNMPTIYQTDNIMNMCLYLNTKEEVEIKR